MKTFFISIALGLYLCFNLAILFLASYFVISNPNIPPTNPNDTAVMAGAIAGAL